MHDMRMNGFTTQRVAFFFPVSIPVCNLPVRDVPAWQHQLPVCMEQHARSIAKSVVKDVGSCKERESVVPIAGFSFQRGFLNFSIHKQLIQFRSRRFHCGMNSQVVQRTHVPLDFSEDLVETGPQPLAVREEP